VQFRVVSVISFDLASAVPGVAVHNGPKAATLLLVRLCQKQNYRSRLLFLFQTAPFYEYIEHMPVVLDRSPKIESWLICYTSFKDSFSFTYELYEGTKIKVSCTQHYRIKLVALVLNCGPLFYINPYPANVENRVSS
jgi:hypothetical protein